MQSEIGKITYCSWFFGTETTDGIIRGKSSKLSEKIDCDTGCWFCGLSALPVSHDMKEERNDVAGELLGGP